MKLRASTYRKAAVALPFLLGQGLIYLYVVRGVDLGIIAAAVVGLVVLVAVIVAASQLAAEQARR